MKILFTGGSSFTGSRFIRELAAAGHQVTAIFRRPADDYTDEIRRRRVAMASEVCRPVYGCSFGDERVPRPDRGGRLGPPLPPRRRRHQLQEPRLRRHRGPGEQHPQPAGGARGPQGGRLPPRAPARAASSRGARGPARRDCPDFSPYGLSKALTAQVFRYYMRPRRASAWVSSSSPTRSAPTRSRGSPPISSRTGWPAAARTAPAPPTSGTISTSRCWPRPTPGSRRRSRPTASPGPIPAATPRARAPSRSAWPRRCAPAWELPCPVELKKQVDFPEPRVRINTDPVDADAVGWDESAAWDEMADYYLRFHSPSPRTGLELDEPIGAKPESSRNFTSAPIAQYVVDDPWESCPALERSRVPDHGPSFQRARGFPFSFR